MANKAANRGIDFDIITHYINEAAQIASATNDVYKIVCVTHGTVEYWVEDQYYRVTGGDMLIIPRGVMVAANIKQRGLPCGRYEVWGTYNFMKRLLEMDEKAGFAFNKATSTNSYLLQLPMAKFEELYASLETAVAEGNVTEQFNSELAIKALMTTLLIKVNRCMVADEAQCLRKGSDNRLSKVLAYIKDHCTESLTVDGVAEMFGYSPSHLAHSFKKQLGTSLYHYVLVRRLQIGRDAMLCGTPVKQAYQECGFGDYAGFYRAFTKEFGMSPQQYKKYVQ